jgi:hypothetical protein
MAQNARYLRIDAAKYPLFATGWRKTSVICDGMAQNCSYLR